MVTLNSTLALTYKQLPPPGEEKSTKVTKKTYPSSTANGSAQADTPQISFDGNAKEESSFPVKKSKFAILKPITKTLFGFKLFSKKHRSNKNLQMSPKRHNFF